MKRFWDKVYKTEACWLWQAGTDDYGYGLYSFEGKLYKAHRFSWFLNRGQHPSLLILYECDIPACVNPEHLFEGTHADNSRDRDAKGRGVLPYQIGKQRLRKIQDAQVLEAIRTLLMLGVSLRAIAKQHGVSTNVIFNIKHEKFGY